LVELVSYRGTDELARARDVVGKVGLTDRAIALATVPSATLASIAATFEESSSAPAHCATPRRARPMHPIVEITTTEISVVDHGPIANVADVGTADTLPRLLDALGTPALDKTLVVRAHTETPVTIVNRVVNTAKQAGFVRIVFAVTD
jgi:hypothetical protein